jgi:hypothetical protein
VTSRDDVVAALLAERFGGPPVRGYKNERRRQDSEADQAAHEAAVRALASRVRRNPRGLKLTAAQRAVAAYEQAQAEAS